MVTNLDAGALTEAEKKLGLSKPHENLHDLTLNDLIEVLLLHENAPRLSRSKDATELRELLTRVRHARNNLAHFRGDLSPQERRVIKFANDWLDNNLPSMPQPGVDGKELGETTQPFQPGETAEETIESPSPNDDRLGAPVGSYAKLAELLSKTSRDGQVGGLILQRD